MTWRRSRWCPSCRSPFCMVSHPAAVGGERRTAEDTSSPGSGQQPCALFRGADLQHNVAIALAEDQRLCLVSQSWSSTPRRAKRKAFRMCCGSACQLVSPLQQTELASGLCIGRPRLALWLLGLACQDPHGWLAGCRANRSTGCSASPHLQQQASHCRHY